MVLTVEIGFLWILSVAEIMYNTCVVFKLL
jgi:hypothetical protein